MGQNDNAPLKVVIQALGLDPEMLLDLHPASSGTVTGDYCRVASWQARRSNNGEPHWLRTR